MKRIFVLLLLLALAGCGEEDDIEGTAPYIAGLDYRPQRFVSYTGTKKISGWLWFSDSEGDFEVTRLSWNVCGAVPVQQDIPVFYHGVHAGKMEFTWTISTDCPPGDYVISVTAVDSEGNESNPLFASINFRASFWEW